MTTQRDSVSVAPGAAGVAGPFALSGRAQRSSTHLFSPFRVNYAPGRPGRSMEKAPFPGPSSKPSSGLEPSTPSLPWRFRGVTRVHARSLATHFLLQIGLVEALEMRRETSRVSFLMCPFCVRGLLAAATTSLRTSRIELLQPVSTRHQATGLSRSPVPVRLGLQLLTVTKIVLDVELGDATGSA